MEKFTKRIILFLTLTLGLIGSASAAVRTFVPTATGTYAWTGNWGTNPVTGDDIIILPAAGATVTITGVPTISLATMTIGVSPTGTTGTVVLQSASGVTITLTGTSTPFRAFCNLTLGSAVSINAGNNGATAAASIAASRTVSVGANTFTWTGGGAFSVGTGGALTNASGGTINFTRSGSQSLPANMTIAGTLFLGGNATTNVKTWTSGISNTIGSTGKLQIGGGSTGAATTSGTAPTYSAGASLEYSATIAQTIAISDVSAASTGVNLIVSNATTNGISLGASRTFNNVTFTTGKLNLAGFTLTVNGAFSGMTGTSTCIMGGATGTANTCGLVVNGTGAAGTVWMSQSAGFTALKTFTFNRTSGTISFANSHLIATNGAYNLYSGTVTTGSFLQFYTGTTLTRYVNGLMSAAPTMFSGSYNIVYGDGTTQNITTGVELLTGTSSLNNFTVNNSAGTVTLNTSTSPTVNGTLTINAGKLAIGANTLYIEGDLANASGVITGSTSSNLTINGSGTLTGSLKLDQTSAATRTIATYSQNQASTGVVNLGSDMIVSSSFTFGSTGGLFALNNFNLSLGVSATIGGTPAVTKMIVTNGTGQMIKNFATGNTSQFTFPIGDNITGGEYSPVAIDYSANSVARNIGVRVVDDNPPGTLVTDYLSRYWVFTDDQLANTYTLASMDLYYNQSGDLNGTEGNILPAGWNGTTWAPYPGSITAFSDYVTVTGNESTALLNGRTITGRLTPPVYTWIATSGSGDWQVGTNWTPTRSNPTANDVLQFINGGTPTATNVPTQTISSLEISGNTSVILTPTSTNTLTISDGTGADLDIQSGSSLSLSGNLTISFTSTGTPTTTIAGTLTVGSGSNYDGYYAATTLTGTHNNNGTTTLYSFTTADIYNVNSGGVFVNSGTLSGFAAASFIVNNGGKYQHNLSSGTIPTATWNAGSTCEVTGAISSIPSGMGQTFSNFTWNTSTQSTNVTLNSDLNVTGTFTMANSAGTTYALTISSSYDIICGNYAQTGGRLNMSASGTGNLLVSGSFSMSAGQINTTSSGIGLITFNGTASQNVNITGGTILGASASLPVNYRVNGTVGINIVTGSTLTVG
ncbi:MAG: hypothetical protein M0D57_11640 [Sphingobacteriales bacterium JAD_PAG50586_3]|nr:MAG: hypothetical protein M0D57_11640 [Sphingobacteriales bacterium JAD_PAG50586_3]